MTGGFWGADADFFVRPDPDFLGSPRGELADAEAPRDGRSDGVDGPELLVRLATFAALPSA